jgi:hypothetical protein
LLEFRTSRRGCVAWHLVSGRYVAEPATRRSLSSCRAERRPDESHFPSTLLAQRRRGGRRFDVRSRPRPWHPAARAVAAAKASEAAREAAVVSKDLLHDAAVASKDLFEEARKNPFVASLLPERKSLLKKFLAPESRSGQLAVVLLGTAIAATGGTLAARTIGVQPAMH